jgi:tetratricopeptide (TPR) repeat protein
VKSLILIIIIVFIANPVFGEDANKSIYSNQSQQESLNNSSNQLNNASLNVPSEVNATTWNEWGNMLVRRGQHNYSLYWYDQAIKLNPEFIDPHNNKGVALVHTGRYEDAIESFNNALQIDPENSLVWSNKGEALFRMGNIKESMNAINKSLELDSSSAAAWNNKGVILAKGGELVEALYCFNKSIELDNFYAPSWSNKGVILAKNQEYVEALHTVNNAATLRNNYTEAWVNGGLILEAMGEDKKAREAFSIAHMMGYNNTIDEYELTFDSILMKQNNEKTPGWEAATAMIVLLATRIFAHKKREGRN